MSLFNNKKNKPDNQYQGEKMPPQLRRSDRLLDTLMLVSVAVALTAIVFCIFILGRTFVANDGENETTGVGGTVGPIESFTEPVTDGDASSEEITDPESEPPTDSIEDPTEATEPETEPQTEPETSKPTEGETTIPVPPETDPEPEGYVPVTPDDVEVIGYYDIQSYNAILFDCDTGLAIAQRLADQYIYPASLTKIMTVVVAYENIKDLNATFTMKAEHVLNAANQGASLAGFWAGSVMTMKDLIYGAILPSGAEATYALADYVAGSEEEFAKLMNAKARELGMTKTHFVTVTGLHDNNHYSTVRDMATLMNYAVSIPFIKEAMSAVEYMTSNGKYLSSIVFNKTNYEHKTYDNGVTMMAGKSGYTPEAGYCLATYYEAKDGSSYILVTARATSSKFAPITDAKTIIEKYVN